MFSETPAEARELVLPNRKDSSVGGTTAELVYMETEMTRVKPQVMKRLKPGAPHCALGKVSLPYPTSCHATV